MVNLITTVDQAKTAGAYDAQNGAGAYKNAPTVPTTTYGGGGSNITYGQTITDTSGNQGVAKYDSLTGKPLDPNASVTSQKLNAPSLNVPTPSSPNNTTTLAQTLGAKNQASLDAAAKAVTTDATDAPQNGDSSGGLTDDQVKSSVGLIKNLFGDISPTASQDALNTIVNNSGLNDSRARITELRNQIALQTDYMNAGLSKIGDETIATPIIGRQQRLLSDQQGRKIALLNAQLEAEQGNYNMAQDLVNMQYTAWKNDNDQQFQIKNAVLGQLEKYQQYNLDLAKMKVQNDYDQSNKLEDARRQILTNYYQAGGKAGSVATAIGDASTYDELLAVGGQYTQSALEKAQLEAQKASTANAYSEIAARKAAAAKVDAPDIKNINGIDMQWDGKSGTWIPAQTSGTATGNQQAADDAQGKLTLVNSLLTSGLPAVGPNFIARLSPLSAVTGAKQNFIAGVQQLTSQETLSGLLNLKKAGGTLGALNESEGEMLRNAATKINDWEVKDKSGNVTGYNVTESDFKAELTRIQSLTQKALQAALPKNYNLSADDISQVQSIIGGSTSTANSTKAFNPASYY